MGWTVGLCRTGDRVQMLGLMNSWVRLWKEENPESPAPVSQPAPESLQRRCSVAGLRLEGC